MTRQSIFRIFQFEVNGNTVRVPVVADCSYDEYGFVFIPKVKIGEARFEPYRMVAVPESLLPLIHETAYNLAAEHYDWKYAYEQDTKPV